MTQRHDSKWRSLHQRMIRVPVFLFVTAVLLQALFWSANYVTSKYEVEARDSIATRAQLSRVIINQQNISLALATVIFEPHVKDNYKSLTDMQTTASDSVKTLENLIKNPEVREALAKITSVEKVQMAKVMEEIVEVAPKSTELAESLFRDKYQPLARQTRQMINDTRDMANKEADLHIAESRKANTAANIIITSILLISVSFVAYYTYRLSTSLNKSLSKINSELEESAAQTDSVSNKVAESSERLSQATTEQAAAVAETAASLTEMTSMLASTGAHATTALSLAQSGERESQHGKEVTTRLKDVMTELQEATVKLERMRALISEMEKKTSVINDIVFESRLLAFNAAIEAARAGALGKGFAVVADEVGKLAVLSGNAAEEIRNLLRSGGSEVSEIVALASDRIRQGNQVAEECQNAFMGMSESLENIREAVRGIEAATREQQVGVREIQKALTESEQVTHSNAASAEILGQQGMNLAESSSKLKSQVFSLSEIVLGSKVAMSKSDNHQNSDDFADVHDFPLHSTADDTHEKAKVA